MNFTLGCFDGWTGRALFLFSFLFNTSLFIMVKYSTSASKSKAKTRKSSSLSKGAKIYCSKVVGTILDKLIEDELSKVKKHPKTVSSQMYND
jgi:hypothetical protein